MPTIKLARRRAYQGEASCNRILVGFLALLSSRTRRPIRVARTAVPFDTAALSFREQSSRGSSADDRPPQEADVAAGGRLGSIPGASGCRGSHANAVPRRAQRPCRWHSQCSCPRCVTTPVTLISSLGPSPVGRRHGLEPGAAERQGRPGHQALRQMAASELEPIRPRTAIDPASARSRARRRARAHCRSRSKIRSCNRRRDRRGSPLV
jgi:hypothetical protein